MRLISVLAAGVTANILQADEIVIWVDVETALP